MLHFPVPPTSSSLDLKPAAHTFPAAMLPHLGRRLLRGGLSTALRAASSGEVQGAAGTSSLPMCLPLTPSDGCDVCSTSGRLLSSWGASQRSAKCHSIGANVIPRRHMAHAKACGHTHACEHDHGSHAHAEPSSKQPAPSSLPSKEDDATKSCWSCDHMVKRGGVVCYGCDKIQPVDETLNHFEMFGM